jgi:predicted ATPase/DNA-binding SARP family transcriptional activator/Tfp pilus assembly protein PilF
MTPRLRLLGRAKVFDGQRWLEAPHDKRLGLLAYLACAGDWVEREKLAFLFWPDIEDTRARRDLRNLIYRTRELSFAANLDTQPGSVRWHAETDVHSLQRAADQEEWAVAVALYAGELLQGLHLDDSPEFMAWLELERANLHNLWREAVLGRAAELERASQHLEAASLLKVLAADELDEDALQLYLRAAFRGGRREEAVQSYRRFTAKLQAELGLEPLPATQELFQALRSGRSMSDQMVSQAPARAPHAPPERLRNFPSESTSFIGRDLELTDVVNTLNQPNCRLLTLIGPGGIGKTRLAQRAALEVAAGYADGVTFVPLASVGAATLLASAIASALSFSFYGQDLEHQLLSYLRGKEMLLVLDNLEHLLEGAPLIAGLLEGCPKLKILATSRERLCLSSEWLFHVGGMSLPEDDEVAWLEGYDAVQLFLRRARRVRADFALAKENRAAVVQICGLVGGAPLGIELAAGWVTVLSCEEIAEEMEKGFDFLSSSLRDVPERQRSLRRVFEHSWRLLLGDERTAFKRLSVFRGGFTRKAAERVADVSMRALLSLVNKSLVKRSPGGRFDLHELVKQYAAEKLAEAPEEERRTRDRHCDYYVGFLREREQSLEGREQQRALREIEGELDNIRLAWRWAVRGRKLEALEQALQPLLFFYEIPGLYQEGEEAFRMAVNNLPVPDEAERVRVEDESLTLGRLLVSHGVFQWWLGRLEKAEDLFKRSLAMLTRVAAPPKVLHNTYLMLGIVFQDQGELGRAKEHLTEALDLARRGGNLFGEPRALTHLGMVAEMEGRFDQAEAYYQEGMALFRRADEPWGLSMGLANLGSLAEKLGRVEVAKKYYLESLEVARAVEGRTYMAGALLKLARLSYSQGQYEEAEAYYRENLSLVQGRDDETFLHLSKLSLIGLAETAHALKSYGASLGCFREALAIARAFKDAKSALAIVVGTADALIGLGEKEKALELVSFALEQAEIEASAKVRAERLYLSLTERLPEDVVAAVKGRGRSLRLDEITTRLAGWQPNNLP